MKTYFFILLFFLNLSYLNGQTYSAGDILQINANGGLNLRDMPALQSKILKLLSYGQQVRIEQLEHQDTIGNLIGNWVKIEVNQEKGYVFDGFLTSLPTLKKEKDTNGNCVNFFMEGYLQKLPEHFGIKDTTNYNNGSDDTGYKSILIYNLKGGHQYINHFFWESYGLEVQFNRHKIRDAEVIQLLKNAFHLCQKPIVEIESKLKSIRAKQYYTIDLINNYGEGFRVRGTDNRIIIEVFGGS